MKLKIRDFNEEDFSAFERLNTEWIEKYFEVEENDREIFSNPKAYIIDKGGRIFYAYLDEVVVGTVSIIPHQNSTFELGKMAVTENAKGFGIGNALLKHALEIAKQMHIERIFLIGNTRLEASIHLYRKFGFKEIPLGDQSYKRGNIKMELIV